MNRYRATISYDGTSYFGWQKTNAGPSIQETFFLQLKTLFKEASFPEAASRTDRGVHAEGQVISFSMPSWDEEDLLRALNGNLPFDIRVQAVAITPPSFHPTLDAVRKEYRYKVFYNEVEDPTERHFRTHFRGPLDFDEMRKGANELIGTHDFSSFANEAYENPICTVENIEFLNVTKNTFEIAITGTRFLYKMARNISGALLYAGKGKCRAKDFPHILASKDRRRPFFTAPAHGLTLYRVDYQ